MVVLKKYWNLNSTFFRIILHLAFWALSFFVFLYFFKTANKAATIDYVYTAIFQLTLLPAVYINLKILMRWLARPPVWGAYILAVLILIILFAWVNFSFFNSWSIKMLPDYYFISYFSIWEIVLFFVFYLAITTLLKFSKSWFLVTELQKKLLEKEKQKSQAELKALKAQINPHFFFNTLNNVYAMSLDKDERLPSTILQLSGLMRYFLYETTDDFILLQKELLAVNDYIALQKIRSPRNLNIFIEITGVIATQKIAPMLLIIFLENAFKHSAKGFSENALIKMQLNIAGQKLVFDLENNIGQVDETVDSRYNGLGLENVKTQLDILYKQKHLLNITTKNNVFFVHLELDI